MAARGVAAEEGLKQVYKKKTVRIPYGLFCEERKTGLKPATLSLEG